MSVTHHISGTVHHMVVICGRQVYNDNISRRFFLHFFKILTFWFVRRVKGQKMAQIKKLSLVPYISGSKDCVIFIYGTQLKKDNISRCFFQILIFGVQGKRVKNRPKSGKIVCRTPYLGKHTSYRDFWYKFVK